MKIHPTYNHVKELRAEESTYNQALTRAKELQQVRDQLLARYNTFSPTNVTRLEKLVPDHVDNVRLILDLDTLASKYGMRVRDVQIQSDNTRGARGEVGPDELSHESVVLSFQVSGTYDTFRQYLADLEKVYVLLMLSVSPLSRMKQEYTITRSTLKPIG
jgi:Tfp pilus assembly protein PilO